MNFLNTVYLNCHGITPNTGKDYTKQLNEIFKNYGGDTLFIFEKGKYDFHATFAEIFNGSLSNTEMNGAFPYTLHLKNAENIALDFSGSTLIFHGETIPILQDGCKNVSIKNAIIDYSRSFGAEGVILNCTENFLDVEIDAALYPYRVENEKLIFCGEYEDSEIFSGSHVEFCAKTKKVAPHSGDMFPKCTAQDLGDGIIRFNGNFIYKYKAGNYIVLRHTTRKCPAAANTDCVNISYENITVHNNGGLGILSQFCDGLTFKRVNMLPSDSRNVLACHDDGLHLSNIRGKVLIEECYFTGLMDDCVNLHGTAINMVEKQGENVIIGQFMESSSTNFPLWARKGDSISFWDKNTLARTPAGTVERCELVGDGLIKLTFSNILPENISQPAALENTANDASMICRRNYFGSGRARGVLVTACGKIVLEDNVFDTSGCAILISGDCNYWYESGPCTDVEIKNNMFTENCLSSLYQFCEGVISVFPEVPRQSEKTPFHGKINIIQNTFMQCEAPILYAVSTENILFTENKIIRAHLRKSTHPRENMLTFNACPNVTISENTFVGSVLGRDALIGSLKSTNAKIQPEIAIKEGIQKPTTGVS